MPDGFAPRFALEAGFLILLGVGSGFADLRTIVIAEVVAAGWLLVTLIELATWRARPRPSVPFVAPPEAASEPAREPEPQHGWPLEPEPSVVDVAYPLRADAGAEPSDEVEAYTRVLEREHQPEPSGG